MSLPKVSIVIPFYKAEHFEQCLRSAIGQTYPNTEILVSDNCPTDEIRDIYKRNPGVLYTRNIAARDKTLLAALSMGTGQYFKPLFDDDLLHPFVRRAGPGKPARSAAALRDPAAKRHAGPDAARHAQRGRSGRRHAGPENGESKMADMAVAPDHIIIAS